jgi:hypothetical protein
MLMGGIFIGRYYWWPLYLMEDYKGATPRKTEAEVLSIYSLPVTRGRIDPSQEVSLKLADGKMALLETHADLHVGQKLRVSYRIGKSGRVYVDLLKP